MFWIGIVFVLFASVIAFWIGRPIIWLSFNNEKYNAAFRYALVRLRDASEAVAFYRGEVAERTGLRKLFAPVVSNYKRYVDRSLGFNGWNWSMSQTIVPLPYLLQFPRFYSGEITLGAMTQSASAFGQIQDGLSFFRNVYDTFAGYRAAIIRLHGLVIANEEGRALPEITTMPCVDGTVQLDDIEVRTPDGKQLIKPLDMRLEVGDTLVVTGPSGSGKTTLLRSLAELWPFTSGTLTRPCGPNETMFLSQLPYVPLGDLRAVVTYPSEEGTIDDDTLKRMLEKVALPHLVRPARRGAGLGQGALPRRTTADRVRPHPADQTQGGVPRRVHVRARRGPGVHALQPGAHRAAGHHSGQRQPPQHRRAAPHARTRAARRRRMAVRPGARRRDGTRARVTHAGVASPAWKPSRPTLDWGNELVASALWVARAWAIAAVATLIVLALVARYTDLGPAVLAHHRRLFQGPPEHSGVGVAWAC